MALCVGKKKATNANKVISGRYYCMWFNLSPARAIPVKILYWRDTARRSVRLATLPMLKSMPLTYELLVEDMSPAGGRGIIRATIHRTKKGAVFDGTSRVTFHEILPHSKCVKHRFYLRRGSILKMREKPRERFKPFGEV